MKTAYKFRIYPTKQQEARLDLTLETCRHLYNVALADRKNAYEIEGISRSYEDQAAMLTAEKKNAISKASSLNYFEMCFAGWTSPSKPSFPGQSRRKQDILDSRRNWYSQPPIHKSVQAGRFKLLFKIFYQDLQASRDNRKN
jgi:transposase